jgi:hypothetical protein
MTRRVLGLKEDAMPTVTGGLSFFGAPLNNYMTHASCAMVRQIRDGHATTGLLYGQGEFVTKHHALLVSRSASQVALSADYNVQKEIDRRRGKVLALLTDYRGSAAIETHTIIYDRDGAPMHGIVIAITPNNERIMARVPGSDEDLIGMLSDSNKSPIGQRGYVTPIDGGLLRWTI